MRNSRKEIDMKEIKAKRPMISREEALSIMIQNAPLKGIKEVPLANALNRVLAEEITSDIDMPPFDKSAYDGFAARRQDLDNLLTVVEELPAGKWPEKTIEENQCSHIMTGAPMSEGADVVIPVEDCEVEDGKFVKVLRHPSKSNMAYKAEDIKSGDAMMFLGQMIKAQQIAVLASMGKANVKVYQKVKVGVLSTGSELVEPGEPLALSQIRNSNGHQISAQLQQMGAEVNYLGILKDDEELTYQGMKKGIEENDVLILSGGVSMGDYDFIPVVLKQLGIEIKFDSIRIQPGKPSTFGIGKEAIVIGLPGNPVSSFTIFEVLAKPFLYQMMGYKYQAPSLMLPFGEDYNRKKAERESWIPIQINEDGEVMKMNYHGSAHINALTSAQGMTFIPAGSKHIKKGEKVYVRLIS